MARVRGALQSVPGVRKTEVDFAKKEACVAVPKAERDDKALVQALAKAGYDASVKASRKP